MRVKLLCVAMTISFGILLGLNGFGVETVATGLWDMLVTISIEI